MTKMIRLVRTEVYEYEPNLSDGAYMECDIKTIEDALELDKKDLEAGKVHPSDLVIEDPTATHEWSIVDV